MIAVILDGPGGPLYTGRGPVKNGANIVWIIWLVVRVPSSSVPTVNRSHRVLSSQLIPTFYFGGMLLLPRQYRQEKAAQKTNLVSDNGSEEPMRSGRPSATY